MASNNTGKQVVPTNTEGPSSEDDHSVLELCKEAWRIFFNTGNHDLPLKILEEASLLYNNNKSALIHRVRGEIFSRVSLKLDFQYYYSKARQSAKEATRLSPNSIGFSLFYLIALVSENVNEALEEGNRGLAIQNPIDPAAEDFADSDRDFKTYGERIGFVRRNIREIVAEINDNDLGNTPDHSKMAEFLQKVADNNKMALQKALPRKVAVKQISDHPKWKIPPVPPMVNKEVLLSEIFIRETCKEALRIFKTEGSDLPLKIIQEARFYNKNSALLHRAQGEICNLVFSGQDKRLENCKDEYLFKAKEPQKEAVRLSPNSIEFAMHYVKVLFLSVCYQDALEEGERALAIQDPIDPAEHYLTDVAIDLPNSQERIDYKRKLILDYVEASRELLSENADNPAEAKSDFYQKLLAKQKNTMDQALPRMVQVQLLLNYPNKQLGLSEEERRQKIAALLAVGKIIQSFQEDSIEKPESEKLLRYWKSMSADNKQKLLKLNTNELFAQFSSKSTRKMLSEAFTFYEANKSWTFKGCFCCDKKFANDEEHLEHTMKEHVGSLSPQQDTYLPTELDDGWDSVVHQGIWSAFDASAALRILEDKLELKPSIKEEVGMDEDRMQCAINHLFTENCPISDDSQRIFALENVQTLLQSLLENEFLAAEHVKMVTEYSMDRLVDMFPGSRLWELGLHQTHLCICFLGLSELIEILEFLEELIKISNIIEINKIPKVKAPQINIKEEIDLDGKSLCLLLDEQFISPSDDTATPDEDEVFKSMFQGSSSEEGLEKWVQLENERKQKGKEIQQILKNNVNSMKKWCDQKSDLLRSEKATEDLTLLLNREFMARKHSCEHVPRSYEAILQKQQEETEGVISGKERKSRLDVIKQALSVDYRHEEMLAVVRTKISEMDMYEDGELEKPTPFQQVDNRIKEAMQRIAKSIGLKILKANAKIMRAYKENEKLEPKLNKFSGADFRTILLPLVKSCISAKLEKQANIAVEEKPEVAKEDTQAHVSPETKKSVNEKGNQSKKKQKSAQKKQNKKGKGARELQSSTEKKEETVSPDDADLKKEEERLRWEAEEEGRMLEENVRRYQKSLDDQKKAHLAQKEREAAQQADTPGLTATTAASTDSAAGGGSSISNVPDPNTEDN